MFIPIIIISNVTYQLKESYEIIILKKAQLIDHNTIKSGDEIYNFDYLIVDNLSLVDDLIIEKEHQRAITNYNLQTSIENIFAIGEANNSSRDVLEELNSIFEFFES